MTPPRMTPSKDTNRFVMNRLSHWIHNAELQVRCAMQEIEACQRDYDEAIASYERARSVHRELQRMGFEELKPEDIDNE